MTLKQKLEQVASWEAQNERARKRLEAEQAAETKRQRDRRDAEKRAYWAEREAVYVNRLLDAAVAPEKAKQMARAKVERDQLEMADVDLGIESALSLGIYGSARPRPRVTRPEPERTPPPPNLPEPGDVVEQLRGIYGRGPGPHHGEPVADPDDVAATLRRLLGVASS